MKTILTILTIFLIIGCGHETIPAKEETPINTRIHVKQCSNQHPYLHIIEVDSVEYLVNYNGGIIRLK
jgi:hypothetical protein